MRKSELNDHHEQLREQEQRIHALLDSNGFPQVFAVCQQAFPHVVAATKFREQNSPELISESIVPLSVICHFAPPLFEHGAIESVAAFVKSNRFLAKHPRCYPAMVEAALRTEEVSRVLWNRLELEHGIREHDLYAVSGVAQETAVTILEFWSRIGVVERSDALGNAQVFFNSRLDDEAVAICHGCGAHGTGRTEILFREGNCKRCGTHGHYHIQYAQTHRV